MTDDAQSQFSGTRPIADAHAFDVGRLGEFMRGHAEGFSGELRAGQFKGGQANPTFRLEAWGRRHVMRRKPPGVLLPSAHAVDREFRVIRALAGTDVPVVDPGSVGAYRIWEAGQLYRAPSCGLDKAVSRGRDATRSRRWNSAPTFNPGLTRDVRSRTTE
ncbi:phosphotransferase [Paraburkholderia sp. A3BS-1L]|uniref:phosphotransferase n=1 Tax=Paraburkholderia sp. A3BS-1L TaxID=3028375 RepID=UPI003DA9FC6F